MTASDDGSRGFQGVVVDVHGNYHAQNIRHQPPDQLVEDVVTLRMLVPHLVRAWFFFSIPVVVSIIASIVGVLAAISAATSFGSPSTGLTGFAGLLNIVAILTLVLAIVTLFLPNKEPIGEYSMLIEGHAWAAGATYSWVRAAAMARRTPFQVDPMLVNGVPVLLYASGREQAMLLVRQYGSDLFVGWTMWRARSTIVLIGHFFRDTFSWTSRRPQSNAELRASNTRAMREIVHSLTREGVQAATHAPAVVTDLGTTPEDMDRTIAALPEINLGDQRGYPPPTR